MSAEPALERSLLLKAVQSEYGLEVDQATFLADGTAHAYRLDGPAGRFFAKLLPNTPAGQAARSRLSAEVPLLHALRSAHILPRVPAPLPTRTGAELSQVRDYPLAVYEWIDAVNLDDDWEAAQPDLAPLLGRLHAGTPELLARVAHWPVPPEDFALPFAAELEGDLAALHHRPNDPTDDLTDDLTHAPLARRPALLALRELLCPHERAVRRLLLLARTAQAGITAQPRDFVVCHTDAHGGNVLRGPQGELWIIDWETARLAPPEHDLWMLHAHLPEVLPAYAEALGRPARLDSTLLAFYFYRRVLEDLAMDIGCLRRENTRPEQDDHTLGVIRDYILPALDSVHGDLGRLLSRLPT